MQRLFCEKIWESMGEYGKIWESMGKYERIWEYCRPLQRYCVWRRLPPDGATVGVWQAGHYPACCSPERSVNRLQRASPASHTFSYFPIHSHNLSRGTSGFVTLRRGKRAIRLMALSDRSDRSDRSDLADWHCVNRCNSAYRLLVPSIAVFYSPSNRQKFFSVGLSLYASLACIFASAKSFSRRASRQSLLLRSARRFLTSRG